MMIEVETGVTCLQATGRLGLTVGDTRSWERQEGPSPGSSGGSRTPRFWTFSLQHFERRPLFSAARLWCFAAAAPKNSRSPQSTTPISPRARSACGICAPSSLISAT